MSSRARAPNALRTSSCLTRLVESANAVTPSHVISLKNAVIDDLKANKEAINELRTETQGQQALITNRIDAMARKFGKAEGDFRLLQNKIKELEEQVRFLASPGEKKAGRSTELSSHHAGEGEQFTKNQHQASKNSGENQTGPIGQENPVITVISVNPVNQDIPVTQVISVSPVSSVSTVIPGITVSPASHQEEDDDALNVTGFATPVGYQPNPVINVLTIKPAKTLNQFTGSMADDFTTFLRTFTDHLNAGEPEAEDSAKIKHFLTFLGGRARTKAGDIISNKPNIPFDDLVAEISGTFQTQVMKDHHEEQLRQAKQNPGESVEAFYQRIDKLALRASGGKSDEYTQRTALQAFTNGLSSNLRYPVKSKRPKSLEEAFEEAILQEVLLKDNLAAQVTSPSALAFLTHFTEKANQGHSSHPLNQERLPEVNVVQVDNSEVEYLRQELANRDARIEELCSMLANLRGDPSICSLSWPISSESMIRHQAPQTAVIQAITAHIPVSANDVPLQALIDTGANITVASLDVCNMLGIYKLLNYDAPQAIGLGGNQVKMAGSAIVRFQIGSHAVSHPVHFTIGKCSPEKDDLYSFIFGNDLLSRLPAITINFSDALLHIGTDILPLGSLPSTSALFSSLDGKASCQ